MPALLFMCAAQEQRVISQEILMHTALKSPLSNFNIQKLEFIQEHTEIKQKREATVNIIKANSLTMHLSIATVKIALTSRSCSLRMKYTLFKAQWKKQALMKHLDFKSKDKKIGNQSSQSNRNSIIFYMCIEVKNENACMHKWREL